MVLNSESIHSMESHGQTLKQENVFLSLHYKRISIARFAPITN